MIILRRFTHLLVLLLLSANISVVADNLTSIKNNKNFVISDNISIKGSKVPIEYVGQVEDLVLQFGGRIQYKFSIKHLLVQNISLKKVNRIKGTYAKDACMVEVNQSNVKINYTSKIAFDKALAIIESLVSPGYNGTNIIQGGSYIWSNEKNEEYAKTSHKATEIRQLISNMGNMKAGTDAELVLVTPEEWMIESPVLTEITGNLNLYGPTNGYVNLTLLKEAISKAMTYNINLIVILDFSKECIPFNENLGHSIYSVEGMRFLRAVLSQWKDMCGLTKIHIKTGGAENEMLTNRFNTFLDTISPLTGIEILR